MKEIKNDIPVSVLNAMINEKMNAIENMNKKIDFCESIRKNANGNIKKLHNIIKTREEDMLIKPELYNYLVKADFHNDIYLWMVDEKLTTINRFLMVTEDCWKHYIDKPKGKNITKANIIWLKTFQGWLRFNERKKVKILPREFNPYYVNNYKGSNRNDRDNRDNRDNRNRSKPARSQGRTSNSNSSSANNYKDDVNHNLKDPPKPNNTNNVAKSATKVAFSPPQEVAATEAPTVQDKDTNESSTDVNYKLDYGWGTTMTDNNTGWGNASIKKPAAENKPSAENKPATEKKPAAKNKQASENKPAAENNCNDDKDVSNDKDLNKEPNDSESTEASYSNDASNSKQAVPDAMDIEETNNVESSAVKETKDDKDSNSDKLNDKVNPYSLSTRNPFKNDPKTQEVLENYFEMKKNTL